MKVYYPAEAFALGIVLFSGNMKAAFVSGILLILTVVFAELLAEFLKDLVPTWSLWLCTGIGAGALCSGTHFLGFSATGLEFGTALWVMTFLVGILAARYVVTTDLNADYDSVLFESSIVWGIWILLAVIREFFSTGSIFGYALYEASFQSGKFGGYMFGFITAGLTLAFANALLKKRLTGTQSLFLAVPMILFARPFEMESFGTVIGVIWTVGVSVVLFLSVRKTLKFSAAGPAFRGLPTELLSLGFLYMILGLY